MGEMTEDALLSGALIRFNTGTPYIKPVSRLGLPGTWESLGTVGVDAGDFDSIYYNAITGTLNEYNFILGSIIDTSKPASAVSINGGNFFEGNRNSLYTGHGRLFCGAMNPNTDVVIFGGSTLSGPAGFLYRTVDGRAWTGQIVFYYSPTGIISICYVGSDGSDDVWLAGSQGSGYIYKAVDDGVTFNQVAGTNWTTDILSLASDGQGTGLALAGTTTDVALVYKTTDHGDTWTSKGQIAGAGESINGLAIHIDGLHCLAATSAGVYYSSDAGENWTLVTAATEFFAVVYMTSYSRAFVSDSQYIYYSDNYGVDWSIAYDTGSAKNIKGMCINNQSSIILATSAASGDIYRSRTCTVPNAEIWTDKGVIYSADPPDVHHQGKISLINAGDPESWIAVGGPIPVTCLTTDNGTSWARTVSTGLGTGYFISVARNPTTGICIAIGAVGLGHCWQQFNESNVHDPDNKYSTNVSSGVYCLCYAGDSHFFYMNGAPEGESGTDWYHYSSDDGETWTSVQDTTPSWHLAADSWGNGKAVAIGSYNDGGPTTLYGVRITSNYGATWNWVVTAPLLTIHKTAIGVDKSSSNCYFAAAGVLYKSTDYGATWALLYDCNTYHGMTRVYDILVVPGTGVIYVAGTEKILKSTNSGSTFNAVYCSYDGKYIHSLAISDDLSSMAAIKSPDTAPTFLCCPNII